MIPICIDLYFEINDLDILKLLNSGSSFNFFTANRFAWQEI